MSAYPDYCEREFHMERPDVMSGRVYSREEIAKFLVDISQVKTLAQGSSRTARAIIAQLTARVDELESALRGVIDACTDDGVIADRCRAVLHTPKAAEAKEAGNG